MKRWLIRPATQQAADEAALLFEYPDVKAECLRLLGLLAQEDNPGKPANPDLDVEYLEIHAPNWYRLKVTKFNLRIIFALTYRQGERLIEYIHGETIFDDNTNVIAIRRVVERTPHTYRDVQRDWKAAHRK